MSEYIEDGVDDENVCQEEAGLREIYVEHVAIAVDIQNMMTEFEEILGETKRKHWDEVSADQSRKVRQCQDDQSQSSTDCSQVSHLFLREGDASVPEGCGRGAKEAGGT